MTEESGAAHVGEGTTRRDALKMSGAAALGGVAAMLAGGAISTETAAAATAPAHVPTSLKLSVDGTVITKIKSMEVNESEIATTSGTDPTGQWVLVATGLLTQRVSVTRGFSTASPLRGMYDSFRAKQGKTEAQRIVIEVHGRRGSLINRFTLSDCFPVRWEGPTYDAAKMVKGGAADQPTETIHFTYRKIEWT